MLLFDPGEIYDFELTPSAPGELTLKFGVKGLPGRHRRLRPRRRQRRHRRSACQSTPLIESVPESDVRL